MLNNSPQDIILRMKESANIDTDKELAELLNVSTTALNNWKNRKIPDNKIKIFAYEMNASEEWLRTGKGNSNKQNPAAVSTIQDNEHCHRVDLLDVQAAANTDGTINSDYPEIIQSIWFSDLGIQQILGRKTAKGIKIIKVPTDSMSPTIKPRDLVFIDTNINTFTVDGIYVFKLNDKTFIKRLQMLPTGVLQATSDNTNYLPFEISSALFDTAEIIGKFISVVAINPVDL